MDDNTKNSNTRIKYPVNRRGILACGIGFFASMTAHATESERIKVRDLWAERGEFSELAQRLDGKQVELRGYMAPPLKPEIDFFVLTRIPMAVCPFCDSGVSWPDDLMLVKSPVSIKVVEFNELIIASGRLEIGTKTDETTGFVSRVRLLDATYRQV